MKKVNSILLVVLAISGCASNIQQKAFSSYSTSELKVYDSSSSDGHVYEKIGEIDAIDCSPTWFRISSSENAMKQLVVAAKEKGANAIVDVSCHDSKLGPILFCNNSVTCNATAILTK